MTKTQAIKQARRESSIFKCGGDWHVSVLQSDGYSFVDTAASYWTARESRKQWIVKRTLTLMGLHPLAPEFCGDQSACLDASIKWAQDHE